MRALQQILDDLQRTATNGALSASVAERHANSVKQFVEHTRVYGYWEDDRRNAKREIIQAVSMAQQALEELKNAEAIMDEVP